MALLTAPSAPPAVNWLAAYWADDIKNRANPNNPNAPVDALRPLSGNAVLSTTPTQGPHWIPASSRLNGRAAWVFDSITDGINGLSGDSARTQGVTLVVVCNPDPYFVTGTFLYAAAGLAVRYTSSSAQDTGYDIASANNNISARVANQFNSPILVRARTNRPVTSQGYINVNGTTVMNGTAGLNNPAYADTIILGYSGSGTANVAMGHYGFIGVFAGDVTTDPQWANFLSWVQSWYGFDPTAPIAPYGSVPPLGLHALWVADDYDPNTGVWPDRSGRGYDLAPNGVAVTPLGLRSFGVNSASTNCAKVDNFAGLQFTGDFEVIAKIRGATSTNIIGGCFSGSASTARWELWVNAGNLQLQAADGSGYRNTSSTSPLPQGYEHIWVRATWSKNEGGNTVTRFYFGWDGVTWIKLGNDVSTATYSLPASANPLYVGWDGTTTTVPPPPYVERFIVNDGIGGTPVVDINFATATPGTLSFTESSPNARTVNILTRSPIKVNNVVNGKPVVRFDGTDDSMNCPSWTSFAATYTWFAVVRFTNGAAGQSALVSYGSSVSFVLGANPAHGTQKWYVRNVTSTPITHGSTDPTNWNLIVMKDQSGSAGFFEVNGTQLLSGASFGSTTLGSVWVGSNNNGTTSFAAADVALIGCCYTDAVTMSQWTAFKSWVASTYGITIA